MSDAKAIPVEQKAIQRYRRAGYLSLLVFGGGFAFWATMAPLAGAVIAPGEIAIDGSIKKIQHQTGGLVAAILVKDGDLVSEGQTLVRLDPTVAAANLAILDGQIDALSMRAARLKVERDGLSDFALPDRFRGRADDPATIELMASEKRVLSLQLQARAGQQAQLTKRIEQLNDQIAGLRRQTEAKQRETALITTELDGLRKLYEQNLVPLGRVSELERNAARIDGESGQLAAAIAELGGRIAETELQIINLDQVAVATASKDLRDAEARLDELNERAIAARDQLARIDIRSPRNGLVHQLAVHTVGGVIAPGETILQIVPADAGLTVAAKITPSDIDAVHVGQKAQIRLPGLNHSTTPDLDATVTMVGADLVHDDVTRQAHYSVQLLLGPDQVARLKDVKLVPGMPTEAFISTSNRSFVDYLLQPLRDRMSRALRET